MKTGGLVQTVCNFDQLRAEWNLPYPKRGDILTVSAITKHHKKDVDRKGIVLLHFEELPELPGICDKTINGQINFVEIVPPINIGEFLEQVEINA